MTFVLSNLKSHINEHHEKIYVKTVDMVHQKGVKKHIEGVHKKVKSHVCVECGYAASQKGSLKSHIEAVHRNIRSHICEECGYAAFLKKNLKRHVESVHKMGEKKSQGLNLIEPAADIEGESLKKGEFQESHWGDQEDKYGNISFLIEYYKSHVDT